MVDHDPCFVTHMHIFQIPQCALASVNHYYISTVLKHVRSHLSRHDIYWHILIDSSFLTTSIGLNKFPTWSTRLSYNLSNIMSRVSTSSFKYFSYAFWTSLTFWEGSNSVSTPCIFFPRNKAFNLVSQALKFPPLNICNQCTLLSIILSRLCLLSFLNSFLILTRFDVDSNDGPWLQVFSSLLTRR